jgi:UDP-N-acetylmuramate dehydrogenase
MEFKQNQSLAELTTFKIGGPALYFVEVHDEKEVIEALEFAKQKNIPVLVLGNGSNILVSDGGFKGLVIANKIKFLQIGDNGFMTIGAGENWDDVVKQSVEKNLGGIECLSGIPGSAGGAVVQNIGAYGQTLSDVIKNIKAVEVASGAVKIFSLKECEFEYRNSWFKKNLNKYVVVAFELQLNPHAKPATNYAHVQKHFQNKSNPSLQQLRDFIIQIRASKGYLIMPGFESYKTAGSFFKNPIVSIEQFDKLKPILGNSDSNRFWELPNGVKIAAAFLMQEAGFGKGYREGSVGISPKHSLSIVNFGNASAFDIKAFAEKIKSVVFQKFSVKLEEEVLYV